MEELEQEIIGEKCLNCSGDKLLLKEIPERLFQAKVVCQKCGMEMIEQENRLEELVLDYGLKLYIVKDFEKFCDYIDSNKCP